MKNVLFVFAIVIFISGCGDTIHGKSIAESHIPTFHEKLNKENFEEIYQESHAKFQDNSSREEVLTLFSAIKKKLGKVKSYEIMKWHTRTHNFKTDVVLICETEFEKGTGTETFTFRIDEGKAKLLGYNINSMDMMTK